MVFFGNTLLETKGHREENMTNESACWLRWWLFRVVFFFFFILPRQPDILINSGMSRYFLALYRHTVSAHLPHSGHQIIQ